MRQQRHDVRTERQRGEVAQVTLGIVPVHALDDPAQHGLRHVLDARKAIEDRVLAIAALRAECGAEAAVADDHGRRAVPHALG